MFVQETKQDYCGFIVEFKSDHLFVVLKLSIVLGDVSDRCNGLSALLIPCICAALNCTVMFRLAVCTDTPHRVCSVKSVFQSIHFIKRREDVAGCFVQLVNT